MDVVLTNADGQSFIFTNGFGSTAGVAATLTVVAPPVFLSVAKTGGAVTFTWSTMVGQT